MPKKIIITTDDFGVVPSIDSAVRDLAKKRKINSVAALPNFEGSDKYPSSFENIKALKTLADDLKSSDFELQIGCHVTITSGKPVSEKVKTSALGEFLITEEGNFREYTKLGRPDTAKGRIELSALLKHELQAQVDIVREATGGEIANLSCHHNSLNAFEETYRTYMQVAQQSNLPLPMRSPRILPVGKENLYKTQLRIRHLRDLEGFHRRHMKRFAKQINGLFSDAQIASTDYMDGRHYGPIPVPFIKVIREDRLLRKKAQKLRKALLNFKNLRDERVLELMLHVADSGASKKYPKDLCYTGINPHYFDGRRVEHRSVSAFDFSAFPFALWRDL